MKRFPSELTANDYCILDYVSRHNRVSESDILSQFQNIPIRYHLEALSDIETESPIPNVHVPLINSCYLYKTSRPIYDKYNVHYKDEYFYRITDLGRSALAEYQSKQLFFLKDKKLQYIMLIFTIIASIAGIVSAVASILSLL